MKKIESFEAACEVTGRDAKNLPDVSMLEPSTQKFLMAVFKLTIIAEAINEKWKADYSNWDQKKWTPYFIKTEGDPSSAFVFDVTDCDWATSDSAVGSRLCFESSEAAKYAGTTFIELYNEMLDNK